jgi:hypothetical protein
MRIGEGQYAAKDWERVVAEAELMTSDTINSSLVDDVDLYDHIEKGLYQLRLAA